MKCHLLTGANDLLAELAMTGADMANLMQYISPLAR